MKKTILLGALVLTAAAAYAQESRQDVSISGFGLIGPHVSGADAVYEYSTRTAGVLASYRFLLTPHNALELNYSFAQNTDYFRYNSSYQENPIHARTQEATAAYVFGLSFKNWNPFLEGGGGGVFTIPILNGTYNLDSKKNTAIGVLLGGGVAYEISPSFDIRAEYRGLIYKTPNFKINTLTTNRYEFVQMPSIGIAYHF